jgi:predicted RNase H-like nuclease
VIQIAGVDGCKGGWISISKELHSGKISSEVYSSVRILLEKKTRPVVLAIDIPVGMTESGLRDCDMLARKELGSPRASSVFPAPIRPALDALTREEANEITRSADGRGVGVQAWGLYPRIREIDALINGNPIFRRFIYEVHPEVSFKYWNGAVALQKSKKSTEGAAARCRLVDEYYGKETRMSIRKQHPLRIVADDDIYDAFAALWTSERIISGEAKVLPDPPQIDPMGIEMGIWY